MLNQTLANRYTLTALLGKGAMGTVYRATDTQTGDEVAVKVIARELAFDAEMLERFRREGEALRQLRHPNIVEFVDTFQHEGQQVIVMEYVPAGSLHELVKQGPLPIDRARRVALELCDALTRAHHLGIVHRDLKPENVLIAEDGTPKLTDFGVARLLSEGTRLTGTGMQVGTPYYMSPEAWEGKPLDAQADIWSLGVVLFEMLSGEVPFGGDTAAAVMMKILMTPSPDLQRLRAEVPVGLAQIVGRMLARDRAGRYQTMREVGLDLERGAPTAVPMRPAMYPARPARRIPAWAWGTVAMAAVGIAIGSLWASGTLARLGGQPAATTAIDLAVTAGLERTATVSALQTRNAIRMATDSAGATVAVRTPIPALTPTLDPAESAARSVLKAIEGIPPTFEDDFSIPRGWQTTNATYKDGELELFAQHGGCGQAKLPQPSLSDVVVQVDVRETEGTPPARAGLIIREKFGGDGYGFRILTPSESGLEIWRATNGVDLYFGVYGIGLLRPPPESNTILVVAVSARMAAFVNDEFVFAFDDDKYPSGYLELHTCTNAETLDRHRFDNFKLWDLRKLNIQLASPTP